MSFDFPLHIPDDSPEARVHPSGNQTRSSPAPRSRFIYRLPAWPARFTVSRKKLACVSAFLIQLSQPLHSKKA